MAEDYDVFNARQYFDFNQEQDDAPNDSFFEAIEEGEALPKRPSTLYEDVTEDSRELSDTESEHFFSPALSVLHLKMRRSLSMNNLPTHSATNNRKNGMPEQITNHEASPHLRQRNVRFASQEHINRLAQPKRATSNESVDKGSMTLAQAVIKYQTGTPKRFRSRPSPKINKVVPVVHGATKPHSPKLTTATRIRPVLALSREERETKEMEEAKKFKIRARPVSQRVLQGPLKVDKRSTVYVNHSAGASKKETLAQKAQPKPPTPGKGQTSKLSATKPEPFSFEQRDKARLKRKELLINKYLEEQKKAREFHARPIPKAILQKRSSNTDLTSETGSTRSKNSTEDLDNTVFRARPATVLQKKPFQPLKDENHEIEVAPFNFTTDQRLEARHKFEEQLKEKEALEEAQKQQHKEYLKRLEEENVAALRKQMEVKAQPIKKYKEVIIQPAHKVTIPVAPKFHTDRLRNKENIG